MARKLDGKKVAILVADGFEQVEMTKPRAALDEAGAQTTIVPLKSGKIQGMNHAEKLIAECCRLLKSSGREIDRPDPIAGPLRTATRVKRERFSHELKKQSNAAAARPAAPPGWYPGGPGWAGATAAERLAGPNWYRA